jgi:hypothetical protein
MFATEQAALAFMERCRAELRRNRGALLVSDAESYWDAVRAKEALRGVPGATLETAAYLLLACRSPREKRGGGFEAPVDRTLKLEARIWLGIEGAAKELGLQMGEILAKAAWKIIEGEAERLRKEDRELAKEFCWWDDDGGGEWVGMRGERRRTRTRRGGAKR